MISITPSTPTFRAFNHQSRINLMLSSNCIHSRPHCPILPTSSPRFPASKFILKSPLPHTSRFRVSETYHRFSTKKWKVSCFRHEEFSSSTSNPEAAEEILRESDKSEITKPNDERRNWATSLREVVDALFRLTGKPWTVPWTAETILRVMGSSFCDDIAEF